MMIDAWTYGPWRQFIVRLDDAHTVCVRRAAFPTMFGMAAIVMWAVILSLGSLGVALPVTSLIAGILLSPLLVELATKSAYVVDVGPIMERRPDGGFYRTFPGEDDAA